MPYACIFVPDFPVEAWLRAEPELRGQAVAVLEGKAPLQRIVATNENARGAGIRLGMTRLQAETGGGVVLRVRSAQQEAAAHAALLDCAQSFSPRVEDTSDDTVLLDVAGLEALFGPLSRMARTMAQRTAQLGLVAQVAVAANPDAAALAARGFSGVTVISEGKEAEELGRLPLEALFTNRQAEAEQFLETLERWGIRNLRELAALPEAPLSGRLGQEGLHLQQLARGATMRPLVPAEELLVFEEGIELEYPLVLLEPLAFLLARLLEQVCARVGARARVIQELRLELELENGRRERGQNIFQRRLRLPVPLLDAKVFLKLLQLDLQAHPPGAPIVKIHLAAEPARPRAAQSGLFQPALPEPEKLELTLARIARVVGEDKVGSPELCDTHRPESFQLRRFVPGDSEAETKSVSQSRSLVTASRIFRPPWIAAVTVQDGKPMHIDCPRRKEVSGKVLWASGPWRSSGDWWEQEGWSHEQWDVALQQGDGIVLYRLVRDLLRGKWFVEGAYD